MRRAQTEMDRRIGEGLRATAAPEYDAGRLGALASRIERAARPLLDELRLGVRVGNWWDFAAGWASTLIPVGVTVAVASIALLWLARPPVRAPLVIADAGVASPTLILGAVGASAPKANLVDLAVDEIVSPTRVVPSPLKKR
jgi:hypothetical protein